MPINRGPFNALVDDDGSNTTGTPWNKAQIAGVILDPTDVALAGLPAALVLTAEHGAISVNTVDGADNKGLSLSGGGAADRNRGPYISMYGNESPGGTAGQIYVNLGNVAGSRLGMFGLSGGQILNLDATGILTLYNHLYFGTDNTSDIGALATSRPRFIWAGGGFGMATWPTVAGGANALVGDGDKLYRTTSSRRYKTAIEPLTEWRWFLDLTAVEYADRAHPDGRKYGGFTAEDVAAHSPARNGRPLFAGLTPEGAPDDVTYPHLTAVIQLALQDFDRRLAALER